MKKIPRLVSKQATPGLGNNGEPATEDAGMRENEETADAGTEQAGK